MIEPDVNIKIFREADGYVTYMDCMNIQNFVNANTLMLVYNLNMDTYNFIDFDSLDKIKKIKNDFKPIELHSLRYSKWLKDEEEMLDKFVFTNITGFDLLAGLFSLSIQIKKEKYISISNILREDLEGDTFATFDERLLYRLFINIISIPKVSSKGFFKSKIFFINTQEDLNMIEFFYIIFHM